MATTEKTAEKLGVKAQTLRAAVCRSGSYFGIRPQKNPNGRLIWPDDAQERLRAVADEPAQLAAWEARSAKLRAGRCKGG